MDTSDISLRGFKEVTVLKKDGTSEIVKVVQLSASKMPEYLQAQGDEAKAVCMVCDKQPEWLDTLTSESYETLVGEVEAVNVDFFQRWFERQKKRMDRIAPGALDRALSRIGSAPLPSTSRSAP